MCHDKVACVTSDQLYVTCVPISLVMGILSPVAGVSPELSPQRHKAMLVTLGIGDNDMVACDTLGHLYISPVSP